MSVDLWVSIGVAIPLAVVANIATPNVKWWLDSRMETSKRRNVEIKKKRCKKQLITIRNEQEEISKFHEDKTLLFQEHLYALIKIGLYGAMGSIYGGIFGSLGTIRHWEGLFGISAMLGVQIVSFMVGMLIYLTCAKSMRLHRKVKDFEKYKSETDQIIKELEGKSV